MYSRDFGGIRSEGQLYNLQQEYAETHRDYTKHSEEPPRNIQKPKGLGLDFLRDLKIDDLILIGIGLLLLLDADGDNDIFVLLIALLLFF